MAYTETRAPSGVLHYSALEGLEAQERLSDGCPAPKLDVDIPPANIELPLEFMDGSSNDTLDTPLQSHLPKVKDQHQTNPIAFTGVWHVNAVELEKNLDPSPSINFYQCSIIGLLNRLDETWLPEITACALSLACIVATVGPLIYEDGKSLTQWSLFISPNAMISFMATLAKSSLLLAIAEVRSQRKWIHFKRGSQQLMDFELFDAASRGPLGSFIFLISKHRHALLASVATTITLAALLVDPFVQLAVSFPGKNFPVGSPGASFPVTQIYDPQGPSTGKYEGGATTELDLTLTVAIMDGIFAPPLDITNHCPTGNCTFTSISTLGVCNKCWSVTSQLDPECSYEPNLKCDDSVSTCSYRMPTGETRTAFIQYTNPVDSIGGPGSNESQVVCGNWRSQTAWNSTATPPTTSPKQGAGANIVSFSALQFPITQEHKSFTGLTAWQCLIQFCVKEYDYVHIRNDTVTMSEPTEQPLFITSVPDLSGEIHLSTAATAPPTEKSSVPYTIKYGAYLSLSYFLTAVFNEDWLEGDQSNSFSDIPPLGKQLASANIRDTITNITDGMSNALRTDSRNSTLHSGHSLIWTSYIHVSCGWLSLPILLLVSTFIVLLITIAQTKQNNVVTWKGSSLPVLFYQFPGWDHRKLGGGILDRRAVEEAASRLKGRLDEHNGWVHVKY